MGRPRDHLKYGCTFLPFGGDSVSMGRGTRLIQALVFTGFAGDEAKVEYLKSIGFDVAYNYKATSSIDDALKEGCPNGIDMFYDNVG